MYILDYFVTEPLRIMCKTGRRGQVIHYLVPLERRVILVRHDVTQDNLTIIGPPATFDNYVSASNPRPAVCVICPYSNREPRYEYDAIAARSFQSHEILNS